jgi:hypothetical protein
MNVQSTGSRPVLIDIDDLGDLQSKKRMSEGVGYMGPSYGPQLGQGKVWYGRLQETGTGNWVPGAERFAEEVDLLEHG